MEILEWRYSPFLLVLYKLVHSTNFTLSAFPGSSQGHEAICSVEIPLLAIKLLAKLLKMNSKRLLQSSLDSLHVPSTTEDEDFSFSFLVPVGTILGRDLGRLNADLGCAVCGERSAKRCTRCQTVRYCSLSELLASILRIAEVLTGHATPCR